MSSHEKILATFKETNSITATAKILGACRKTVRKVVRNMDRDLEHAEVPERERSIDEIREARQVVFERRKAHEDASACIQVKVKIDGPIGIMHMGDPHIDDDGTDLALLESHLKLCRDTHGMFAANVGDYTNNWIGRLARLHAHQTTTAAESWRLVEWMVDYCEKKWLYLIGGNHDHWSGDNDPLRWIAAQAAAPLHYHGARFNLTFPNKRSVRINTRHDFNGHSMWNQAHGPMRAAQMGFRDHILTCGHRHNTAYGVIPNPNPFDPLVSHCIRVSAYKVYDDYAKQGGFLGGPQSPAVVTIIDPSTKDPWQIVRVMFDVEQATDYLAFLRRKAAA